ncbi:hypothetical protein Zm00014a_002045 [Zea mays]|uniref:Uncharacterized protein n=1 Tax=Zea mays TaxID=4577 RepID=A0A3L6GE32_MAIZE|nr:hypothetical protein Zm00014a_002045 [Zea mays]
MRKGAASARGSGSTTPAQRNLLSARPNSDLDAAELQKDGSGLQAGGCFPPPRRRSDRCHHRRGRTTELGPRSTSTAATDGHCFLLAPATVALAHSVQQGRIASLCFFCLPRAAAPARLVCPRETRLLGDLSFNPTSFAGPFRFSLCPVVQSAL